MDNDKIYDLMGSIVKARILAKCSQNCAIGSFEYGKLLVSNGKNIGADSLVRIDSKPKSLERGLIGSFITSNIPPGFKDLSNQEYILFALWEKRMKKTGRYPTIEEINQYFNPGSIIHTYFVSSNPGVNRSTRTLIYHGGYHTSNPTTKKMIDTLTLNMRARLIIGEADYLMNPLVESIRDKGLVPIIMEPLK